MAFRAKDLFAYRYELILLPLILYYFYKYSRRKKLMDNVMYKFSSLPDIRRPEKLHHLHCDLDILARRGGGDRLSTSRLRASVAHLNGVPRGG